MSGGESLNKIDEVHLRAAIQFARDAVEKGNHPFGALLVDREGKVLLEAENTVVTDGDVTAHAETNLVRAASRQYDADFLAGCTLYASTEPCAMCAGAIYWGNISRVVYGLSQEQLYAMVPGGNEGEGLRISCREVLARGSREVEVLGPNLKHEAARVHQEFWK